MHTLAETLLITPTLPAPRALGLRRSFGFGDRIGMATPGHAAAARRHEFAPVFAQQSMAELERTGRSGEDVVVAARRALGRVGYKELWGADADGLTSEAEVLRMAMSGFTWFTVDLSASLNLNASVYSRSELEKRFRALDDAEELAELYLYNAADVQWRMTEAQLQRAALRFSDAIKFVTRVQRVLEEARGEGHYDLEISLAATADPTGVLEHYFLVAELQRAGVKLQAFAPRLPGSWEVGVEFEGELAEFEAALVRHAEVALALGPYKISIHAAAYKYAVYPTVGRVCGDLLHLKTSGASYLEALRLVARHRDAQFMELTQACARRFVELGSQTGVTTSLEEVRALLGQCRGLQASQMESVLLDHRAGRQMFEATYATLLGPAPAGQRNWREVFQEVLTEHAAEYQQVLDERFETHFALLDGG